MSGIEIFTGVGCAERVADVTGEMVVVNLTGGDSGRELIVAGISRILIALRRSCAELPSILSMATEIVDQNQGLPAPKSIFLSTDLVRRDLGTEAVFA